MKKPHQKHADLKRPGLGVFGRVEFSILGTNCGDIKKLAYQVIENFHTEKIAYVDASHKGESDEGLHPPALKYGASLQYIDNISFKSFDIGEEINEYNIKQYFSGNRLVIINGNHFNAAQQILIVDEAKPLEKKLDKITKPIAIIIKNEGGSLPEYLKAHLAQFGDLPVFYWKNREGIFSVVGQVLKASAPKLKGLVLAGGKSTRMKTDKALLEYHGESQMSYTYKLLQSFCEEVFVSCPQGQEGKVPENMGLVEDSFLGLGPFGAILSAFRKEPDAAWLVVACDLPYLDTATISHLVENRNISKVATAFIGQDEFPEPLITIWEPGSYQKLLYFLSLGYSCPRKVLINSDCEIIKAPEPKALTNVNYPDEFEAAKKELEGNK